MNAPTLLHLIPTCLAHASSLGLVSLVLFCTLICLESTPYPPEKGTGLVMNHWFSYRQFWSPGLSEGRRIQGLSSDLHTLPCGLVLAGQPVLPVGPAWWHPHDDTPIPAFCVCGIFGQSLSCRWNILSVSGTFHMCNWRGFFHLPVLPGPLLYFPPCAHMKGFSHVLFVLDMA